MGHTQPTESVSPRLTLIIAQTAGSAAVTIRAIYAFLRSCQMTVPSRKPRVKGVQVSLDILATRIIQAGGHLQVIKHLLLLLYLLLCINVIF